MTTATKFLMGMALAAAVLPAAADSIYRCTGPGGSVTYQEIACSGQDNGGVANIPTQFPDYNVVEHNRILQQGAMLDARLLKRLEIESNERIAAGDSAAREKEAQARLAEAQAESQQVYGLAVPLLARNTPLRNVPHVRHNFARRQPRSL